MRIREAWAAATLAGLAVALAPGAASGTPIVIGFDELPPQTFDELELEGVTFRSEAARFGFRGDEYGFFIDEATLGVSTATTLTLDFATPTTLLSFGVGIPRDERSDDTLAGAVTVELFGEDLLPLGSASIDLWSNSSFWEGNFAHDGPRVARAVVHASDLAPVFAIDALSFLDILEHREEVVGVDGASGAAGASGPEPLPGADGAAGAGAWASAQAAEAGDRAIARGGAGGSGGDGGAATAAGVAGGNGGDGAAGGEASAAAISTSSGATKARAVADATGGGGGSGGSGGSPYASAPSGSGADGGAASANASAESEAGDAIAIAEATGGSGGGGGAFGAGAGDGAGAGGSATATSTAGAPANATLHARGGSGGSWHERGGDGASVALVDAVDGSTSGALLLSQGAVGGNGGEARPRSGSALPGGAAGTATSSLTRAKSAASFELRVSAFGGSAGGSVGLGAADAPQGGRADASGDASNDAGELTVLVVAAGGRGFDNYGVADGRAGAAGGDASVTATGTTAGDGQTLRVGTAQSAFELLSGAYGGYGGGRQWSGGDGPSGKGGDARSSSTATALGDSRVEVIDRAFGGEGGAPFNARGDGGAGGDASSTAAGGNAGAESVSVSASATGGRGRPGNYGTTGAGGRATARADAASSGGGDVTVSALAEGGDAGEMGAGPWVFGRGGAGGEATASARGTSTDGDVTVSVDQRAGSGGDGDRDRGGPGASSSAADAASGSTAGTLTLIQRVAGGNGGGSDYLYGSPAGGDGGSATSTLAAENPGGGALVAVAEARSGRGGGSATRRDAGNAGVAIVDLAATSQSSDVTALALARGGAGGFGAAADGNARDGGNADARVIATTAGDGREIVVGSADPSASGAFAGSGGWARTPGNGGHALSESLGEALGDSRVTVIDRAVAGAGGRSDFAGGHGGNATSSARGSNAGDSPVHATALATGGDAGFHFLGLAAGRSGHAVATADATSSGAGDAVAVAEARGGRERLVGSITAPGAEGGPAGAFAISASLGHAVSSALAIPGQSDSAGRSGVGFAHALAAGSSGSASAESRAIDRVFGEVSARAIASVDGDAETQARAQLGGPTQPLADGAGLDAFALLTGDPLAEEIAALASPLQDLGERGLAIGALGLAGRQDGASAAEFSIAFQPIDLPGPERLVLGLFDPSFGAGGFDELSIVALRGEQRLLELSYPDADAAAAALVGAVLELGGMPAGAKLDTIRLLFELRGGAPDARFTSGFVFGVVPEPATAMLVGLGLLALGAGARRRV